MRKEIWLFGRKKLIQNPAKASLSMYARQRMLMMSGFTDRHGSRIGMLHIFHIPTPL
ncbi:hypothetical protein PRUPE_5G045300 [Prunus persica]|uniref:Uncharacterized protein n=1 Tax=Prunus persica TaxID=3760 RepID=A0A251P3R0_PRUPE|nr:hypothetical protein PRUPE_5G045300 [Prunus persica]